jgi:hypothetical protein
MICLTDPAIWDVMVGPMSVIGDAVVVWTGYGSSSRPERNEQRLFERFGSERAADLFPKVRALYDDFYASDARLTAPDLVSMAASAASRFREMHPDIPEEAVQALAWCYTFDYK